MELSIVMPCLNEVRTLASCVTKAQSFLVEHGISGEVLVADNGSTDGSVTLAERSGARVIHVTDRGYGAALAAGVAAAQGKFVIMGDADASYDFSALLPFVAKLRAGYDLVIGNRFLGGIFPGAMPTLNRYLGNPLLTAIGHLFFGCKQCGDFYCGLRGFRKEAIESLQLQSQGMEYALEMIIKAEMHGVRITEVPATLAPDGRDRAPHLRPFHDGWRSLRLYLLTSPRWFFGVPGLMLATIGVLGFLFLIKGAVQVGAIRFDYHSLLYAVAAIVLGYQFLLMFVFTKLIAVETGLHPPFTKLRFLINRAPFERFLWMAAVLGIGGIAFGLVAAKDWSLVHFGNLQPTQTIRLVSCSILLLLLSGQTALAGCFLGLIHLLSERKRWLGSAKAERVRGLSGDEGN